MTVKNKNINKKRGTASVIKIFAIVLAVFAAAALIFAAKRFGLIEKAFAFLGGASVEETACLPPVMPAKDSLTVYAIDVGQGDAFFLVSPNGKTMLIDAGEAEAAENVVGFIRAAGYDNIDIAVGTHPHADHIGAMPFVLSELGTAEYVMPDTPLDSRLQDSLLALFTQRGTVCTTVWCGDTLDWDPNCKVTVLSPVYGCEYSTTDANDWSIIMRVEYGETAMLFTGDATVKTEQLAMFHNERELFEADVLKVAHHGSTTSSSLGFIETVGASVAVISCGRDNQYGHPDFDILNRLNTVSDALYRTDICGSIAVIMNGRAVQVEYGVPDKTNGED